MADIAEHITEKSAQSLYREIMSDMRALRDVEMKFVPFFFQIAAFVVAVNVALIVQVATPRQATLAIGVLSVAFTLTFARILIWKIGRDHQNHEWLGLRAQAVWRYWNGAAFFDNAKYGAGRGYKTNQLLIGLCSAFVVLIVCTGIAVKFFC